MLNFMSMNFWVSTVKVSNSRLRWSRKSRKGADSEVCGVSVKGGQSRITSVNLDLLEKPLIYVFLIDRMSNDVTKAIPQLGLNKQVHNCILRDLLVRNNDERLILHVRLQSRTRSFVHIHRECVFESFGLLTRGILRSVIQIIFITP